MVSRRRLDVSTTTTTAGRRSSLLAKVGYGDICPESNAERLLAMLAMVIGGSFYGYIIANISSIVSASDTNHRAYYERMDMIHTYMALKRFPKPLRHRVHRYFKRYFEQRTALDECAILNDLEVGPAPAAARRTSRKSRGEISLASVSIYVSEPRHRDSLARRGGVCSNRIRTANSRRAVATSVLTPETRVRPRPFRARLVSPRLVSSRLVSSRLVSSRLVSRRCARRSPTSCCATRSHRTTFSRRSAPTCSRASGRSSRP